MTSSQTTLPTPASTALVTVVVPCYNYGRFLSDTLASVASQSHNRWECIVVDDGSTDGTESIVRTPVGTTAIDTSPSHTVVYPPPAIVAFARAAVSISSSSTRTI